MRCVLRRIGWWCIRRGRDAACRARDVLAAISHGGRAAARPRIHTGSFPVIFWPYRCHVHWLNECTDRAKISVTASEASRTPGGELKRGGGCLSLKLKWQRCWSAKENLMLYPCASYRCLCLRPSEQDCASRSAAVLQTLSERSSQQAIAYDSTDTHSH